jgi:hypothetical protein
MRANIRPADLEADRTIVIEALSRHLKSECDEDRFDWLYLQNPHGRALTWIATEGNSSRVLGIASAFPRLLRVNGKLKHGCVLGDFYIIPEHRSLGPALQLQRACLASIREEELAFCYDFPSLVMTAIHKRLGNPMTGNFRRLCKRLRIAETHAEGTKRSFMPDRFNNLGNRLLGLLDQLPRLSSKAEFRIHSGPCDSSFSDLVERVSSTYGICVDRSADYLNWRYLRHPYRRHEIVTAHFQQQLTAYAVFTHENSNAGIVDLFGDADRNSIGSLVRHVIGLLRRRGVVRLDIGLLDGHPWNTWVRRLGFFSREAYPVVTLVTSSSPEGARIAENPAFFLMHGDRES